MSGKTVHPQVTALLKIARTLDGVANLIELDLYPLRKRGASYKRTTQSENNQDANHSMDVGLIKRLEGLAFSVFVHLGLKRWPLLHLLPDIYLGSRSSYREWRRSFHRFKKNVLKKFALPNYKKTVNFYLLFLDRMRAVFSTGHFDAVILPEETVGMVWESLIKVAHEYNTTVLVCPYTIANQEEAFQSLRNRPNYQTRANWLVAHLFPRWRMRQNGHDLVRLPFTHVLAHERLGLTPRDPWLMNSAALDALCVENQAAKNYFIESGIQPANIHVTGSAAMDEMYTIRSRRNKHLGRDADKPLLLISGCPNQLHKCPFCEFTSMQEIAQAVAEALSPLKDTYRCVVRPHPGFLEFGEYLAPYGFEVSTKPTAELVVLSDLFVAFASSTIRWAVCCNVPTINYDVFHYNYAEYKETAGVLHAQTHHEFADLAGKLAFGNTFYQDIQTRMQTNREAAETFDGQSVERINTLLNSFRSTPVPGARKPHKLEISKLSALQRYFLSVLDRYFPLAVEAQSPMRLLFCADRPANFVEIATLLRSLSAKGHHCSLLLPVKMSGKTVPTRVSALLKAARPLDGGDNRIELDLYPLRKQAAIYRRAQSVNNADENSTKTVPARNRLTVIAQVLTSRYRTYEKRIVTRWFPNWHNYKKTVNFYRLFLDRMRTVFSTGHFDAVILPEETVGMVWESLIKVAHEYNTTVLVCPYTIANQEEAFQSLRNRPNYQTRANWLVAHLFPRWRMRQNGHDLVRLPFTHVLAHERLGLTPRDPWLMNSAALDALCVENQAAKNYFIESGIQPANIHVTGSAAMDEMYTIRSRRNKHLGRDADKPLLLISGCPNQLHKCPFCEFTSMQEIAQAVAEALSPLKDTYRCVVRPHPGFLEFGEYLAPYGFEVSTKPTAELVVLSDLFVAFASSTIRWAVCCNVPTINYDVFHYNYAEYKETAGVLHAQTHHEFADLAGKLAFGNTFYQDIQTRMQTNREAAETFDGQSVERINTLLNSFRSTPVPGTS